MTVSFAAGVFRVRFWYIGHGDGSRRDEMLKELDCIALTSDIEEEDLKAGDAGTIVHIYRGVTPSW